MLRLLTPPVFCTGGFFFNNISPRSVGVLGVFLFTLTAFPIDISNLDIKPSSNVGFEILEHNVTGVSFNNAVQLKTITKYRDLMSGSGVTAADFDKDGLCDVYFAGLEANNAIFKNMGSFRFQELTPENLKCRGTLSTSVVSADLNGDTWMDLVVGTYMQGAFVFINNQRGQFEKHSLTWENSQSCAVYGISVSDIENDGDLDLYLSNYRSESVRGNPNLQFETLFSDGRQQVVSAKDSSSGTEYSKDRFNINPNGKIFESGVPDILLLNDGNGNFKPHKASTLLTNESNQYYLNSLNWGLGSIFADINNDYIDDLYVCNDLDGGDYLYYGNGEGNFIAANERLKFKSPMFSMGVDVADINNDGWMDIIVVDMLNNQLNRRKLQIKHPPKITESSEPPYVYQENSRNMLFLGNASGGFDEIAHYAMLESSDWSWSPLFIDVDLDGFQDLLVTNGFSYDLENPDIIRKLSNRAIAYANRNNGTIGYINEKAFEASRTRNDPNCAFKNNRDLTFTDVSKDWNFNFSGVSHGACLADLDNDGDEDVLVNNFSLYIPEKVLLGEVLPKIQPSNPSAGIYRNISSKPRIRVQVALNAGNTHGIGTTIHFTQDGSRQTKQIRSGSRYCSSDQPAVTFAYKLGSKSNVIDVVLARKRYSFRDILPNRLYQVTDSDLIEGNSIPLNKNPAIRKKLFSSLNETPKMVHRPGHTDTSLFQKNINKELFINEPITSVVEMYPESSKRENVIINSGKASYILSGKREKPKQITSQKGRIMDFFAFKHDDKLLLFELRSDNIIKDQQESYLNLYAIDETEGGFTSIRSFKWPGSYNCLNWGVVPGKPQFINLIFGGGHVLGHYPIGDKTYSIPFNLKTQELLMEDKQVIYIGRAVNDSVFSDLDGDGSQELILAPEGDGIQVLTIMNDTYTNISSKLKLDGLVGNWNSIASGDLNGDGNPDLVCGNWGGNSALKRYRQSGYKLHYERRGDTTNLYETYADGNDDMFLMNLDDFKKVHPSYGLIYKSNEEFMDQPIQSVFKRELKSITYTEFNTCIFINRNNEFKRMELAPKVNFLPTFGIDINDYNLDGRLDVFLCQGFTASKGFTESSYNHSGLFLIQDKNGDFEPFDGKDLGIRTDLFGPRSVSSLDINNDNKPDIVIGDNGRPYAFHENISTGTGLKLKLIGNENALAGLKARIKYSNGNLGPMFEYSPKQGFRSSKSRSIIFAHSKDVESIIIDHHMGESIIPMTEDKREYSANF